jgi:aspartokinase
MATDSRIVDIFKRLGDETPPPIRLSRLLESPVQGYFSFVTHRDDRGTVVRILESLGNASVNLRFISEHPGGKGEVRIQFCCDADDQETVAKMFQRAEFSRAIRELRHIDAVVILSLYPFNGQPQVAGRVFAILRKRHIEILSANTATSVFSLIVSLGDLASVIASLKQVFIWQ